MDKQLLFRIAEQPFAIPITDIDKIIRIEEPTVIPGVSSYILGVQDVEGTILPLINLADRFYHSSLEDEATADVVVVNWEEQRVGLAVDEVTAVQTIEAEQLTDKQEGTEVDKGLSTSYIGAFIQTDQTIIPVLNIHALFNDEKSGEIRQLLKIKGVRS